jgi:hypothetical protein
MGIVECVKHALIEPFTVLYDREGMYEIVLFLLISELAQLLTFCYGFIAESNM